MVGRELQAVDLLSEHEYYNAFYFFSEDRKLSVEFFKKLVVTYVNERENPLERLLAELNQYGAGLLIPMMHTLYRYHER